MSEHKETPFTEQEAIDFMTEELAKDATVNCWLYWTCPKCKVTALAERPNAYNANGYRHDDCGVVYKGDEFGVLGASLVQMNQEEADNLQALLRARTILKGLLRAIAKEEVAPSIRPKPTGRMKA